MGGKVMQYIVDSYILEYIENEEKYYISFKDSIGKQCRIEINREIFEEYMKSRKCYKKIQNEYDRHEEQSKLTEISLYNRCIKKNKNLEDEIIKGINEELIIKTIWKLPTPQNKRVYMNLIKELSMGEIAKIEACSISAISQSISIGIKELQKKLKNF